MENFENVETFGEPGAVVYLANCVSFMRRMPEGCVDVIFADPPYRLSSGGISVKSGEVVSVDKGDWDRSLGGFARDHDFNAEWLHEARRVLKPDGTIWATGTHHIIFSLGYAMQSLGFRMINQITWQKPDPPPNVAHTSFTHSHETLIWASRSRASKHTFNYELVNAPNPDAQMSSVWRIPHVPMSEKTHGRHPTQKPLRLVRRALLASSQEGDLVLDPFCGSGTTAVAAKELNRTFVGTELEREYAELAERRIRASDRGSVSRKIASTYRANAT